MDVYKFDVTGQGDLPWVNFGFKILKFETQLKLLKGLIRLQIYPLRNYI